MNLPISTTAVTGVARSFARNVADGLGRALDFDAILRGDTIPGDRDISAGDDHADPELLRIESSGLIRIALTQLGIAPNQELRFDVLSDGQLRIATDHPRAAEIELHLNSDSSIRSNLKRFADAIGPTQIVVGPA